MKTHSTSLTQLNVLNQIKQNKGFATGGKGYDPHFEIHNTTVNTFYTNDKEVIHDEFLMAGLTEKQKELKRIAYKTWIDRWLYFDYELFTLPLIDFFVIGNTLMTQDS